MNNLTVKSPQGKLILLATILASGMAFLDGSVVNIAIPTIQAKLGADLSGIQWIINAYTLMLASLILICGALGDRFGRKRVFISGIVLFTISSFLCSISNSTTELALFRALQGVGGAMMVPGSLSIINTFFESSSRGRAIGLWSGFAGGIAALGPFLGGWLVQTLGWQAIFYINLPIGLLAFLITLKFVPESKNNDAGKVDFAGSALLFAGLLGIAFSLINGPEQGFLSPGILIGLVAGFVSLIIFAVRNSKSKNPLVPLAIFKSPLVVGANLATLCLYFALAGVIFFTVLNFQQLQHYPPVLAGLGLLPSVLLITFLSGKGGSLADKIGPRKPMIIGPLIVSLGMAYIAFSGMRANYFIQFMPGLILFGIGMSIVIAPLTKSALAVEEKLSGSASGVNNAVARIAGLLAVALLGAVIALIFNLKLTSSLQNSSLSGDSQQVILSQKSKLMAIDIPTTFSSQERSEVSQALDNSFLYGFRWIMGINAFLAFLSAVIAYFTIHPKAKHRRLE